RPQRRLGHRQVHARDDVVAVAHEASVRAHVHQNVRVAGTPPDLAGVALARQADPLAVMDAGRNVDVEHPLLHLSPRPLAVGTRRRDDLTRSPALGTRIRADELPEDRGRDGLLATAPTADRTCLWAGPGRGAGGMACRAR